MSMRALRQLTEHADQQHRDAMSTLPEELGEVHLSQHDPDQVATRRNFVRNLGLGGAAIAFGTMLVPVAGLVPDAMAQTTAKGADIPADDLQLVLFAQGLELAAQAAYQAMVATGKLQGQPQESARTFGRHHGEHAAALAALTPKAQVVISPNAKILALFSPKIGGAADANALMQVAFDIETGAASTYQLAMGALTNWQGAAAVATIQPIEAQHAVVWGQTLGLPIGQWMPAFETDANALSPTTYAAS
jgi:hypothetical protein